MDDNKKNLDSPTVAQIDVRIHWDEITPRDMFLNDYTYCPLCGDELLYTHVTHFGHQQVAEEAHCDACKIRVKQNSHSLQ